MRTKTIEWKIEIDCLGEEIEGDFEVEYNATNEEIEEIVQFIVDERIGVNWEVRDDN